MNKNFTSHDVNRTHQNQRSIHQSKLNNSSVTGGQNGRLPQDYRSDPRIAKLQVGESITYDGCVPNIGGTQAGSGLDYCSYYMNYPLSGDSEFELSLTGDCNMCSLYYGCGECSDSQCSGNSGNGPLCYCNAAASWYSGKKCTITRKSYNSDASACCLVNFSQNTGLTTGILNNSDPAQFNWNNIKGNNMCNPDLIDRCDGNASIIAGYCGTLARHGTRLAWESGQPDGVTPNGYSKGYCANYVNAMNVTNKGAAQTVVTAAVDFMSSDKRFSNFGTQNPEYAGTISNLLGFCNNMGSCDAQLSNMCSTYTRDDIFNAYKKYLELTAINPDDPNAVIYKNMYQACGCHLPSSQYAEWNNLGVDQVNVACDPICMLPNVIPQYNNGTRATCTQNLCVLDNITVDIVNSQTGDINFNTLCGNCTSGNCRCVFSDINIFQSGSSVGNINFAQNCGSCSMPDPNNPGNFISIDCKTGMPSGNNPIENGWQQFTKWIKNNKLKTLAISLGIVLSVWLLIRFLSDYSDGNKKKSGTDTVTLTDLLGDYAPYIDI